MLRASITVPPVSLSPETLCYSHNQTRAPKFTPCHCKLYIHNKEVKRYSCLSIESCIWVHAAFRPPGRNTLNIFVGHPLGDTGLADGSPPGPITTTMPHCCRATGTCPPGMSTDGGGTVLSTLQHTVYQ